VVRGARYDTYIVVYMVIADGLIGRHDDPAYRNYILPTLINSWKIKVINGRLNGREKKMISASSKCIIVPTR